MSRLRVALVSGLGTGYLPVAPGTWGSAAVAGIYLLAAGAGAGPWALSGAMVAIAVLAGAACVALGPFAERNRELFACPSDGVFFASEGISYEYRASRVAGKTRRQLAKERPLKLTWIAYDFDPFHGQASMPGARNVLYADAHVGPF